MHSSAIAMSFFSRVQAPEQSDSTAMTIFLNLASVIMQSRGTSFKRKLAQQLELAREKERIDLASDIHDGPLQDLYATRFLLEAPNEQLERILSKVRSELREITMRLESPRLEHGLSEALRELTEWYGEKSCDQAFRFTSIGNDDAITSDVALTLFRMARTAVSNVYKHSEASMVDVAYIVDKNAITLTIKDNGKGFETANTAYIATERAGLYLLRHYAGEIGAQLQILSHSGEGTTIEIRYKLKVAAKSEGKPLKAIIAWIGR